MSISPAGSVSTGTQCAAFIRAMSDADGYKANRSHKVRSRSGLWAW